MPRIHDITTIPTTQHEKVYAHLVEGSESVNLRGSSTTATSSYLVSGVVAKKTDTVYRACLAPGIPREGTPHPDIPGIWVTSVLGRLADGTDDAVYVDVTWGVPTVDSINNGDFDNSPDELTATLEVSSAVQGIQTNIDAFGNQIAVPKYFPIEGPPGFELREFGAAVEMQAASTVLIYRRREYLKTTVGNGTLAIGAKARMFSGTINETAIFGGGPKEWLCSRIHAVSDDDKVTFNVTYEFIQAPQRFAEVPETWDARVYYEDPATGKPAADNSEIDLANGGTLGIKRWQIYRMTEFNLLQIPA